MSLVVCFIDDSPFERDLFNRFYASTPTWEPVVAETYAQAVEMLEGRIPLLWLLDLWGNDPAGSGTARLFGADELKEKADAIPGLDSIWAGLAEFPGDRPNEYLKRFYTIVSGWSGLFLEAARAADQTKAYGLHNLGKVRKNFPQTVALAYTRKSQSTDLAGFLAAGGDGVLLKPHGPDNEAIDRATREQAPVLVERMHRVLAGRIEAALLRQALLRGNAEGAYLFSLAGALLGKTGLPAQRELELEPYLRAWAGAVRTWLQGREG